MIEDVNIASLVIQVLPEGLSQVREKLKTIPRSEVFCGDSESKIVLVLEADTAASLQSMIDQVNEMESVVAANLVYHHQESPTSLAEVMNYDPHTT